MGILSDAEPCSSDSCSRNPSVEQPPQVFTHETYREFLGRVEQIEEEYRYFNDASMKYPIETRFHTPEYKQFDLVRKKMNKVTDTEYTKRLPIRILAKCPYCGENVLQPVDIFTIDRWMKNSQLYYGWGWYGNLPYTKRCKHSVIADFAINLNGLVPDDLDQRFHMGPRYDSAPFVLVWPLVAKQTSVVIHSIPVGRLDDSEYVPRYTAYFMTYFASDKSNLFTKKMFVPTTIGYAATKSVKTDCNLSKWVRAERLFWLDSDDPQHPLVRGTPEDFPYADVKPVGWYRITKNSQIDGPHPYHKNVIWRGKVPHHKRSFWKSTEKL